MSNPTTETENIREELDIGVAQNLVFPAISDTAYMNSVEFCELASNLFKSIFVDYEGCRLVPVANSNQLQMQLFFNHKEQAVPDGMFKACTKDGKREATNQILADIRHRDRMLASGDRYYLTEDGKAGLRKFFFDGSTVFEKDGKIKDRVLAEVTDSASQLMAQPIPQQFTQVSFIDPVKIATMLFGQQDEDGQTWIYNVIVKRSMPVVGYNAANTNFVLGIERISVEQTKKLAAAYGLVFTNGLGIVR